jgi:hypothetical protein
MNPCAAFATIFCISGILFIGCKKQQGAHVDATQPLAQSFQAAEPQVKEAVSVVNNNLKTQNYLQAARALEPVTQYRNLTQPQRDAIGVALKQLKQAVDANPSLDSKELYDLRVKMFKAASGSRF